jgi:hypothetical protein
MIWADDGAFYLLSNAKFSKILPTSILRTSSLGFNALPSATMTDKGQYIVV